MKSIYASIIINPAAGNGKAAKAAQAILQKIKSSSDFEVDIAFSGKRDEATCLARKAIANGASMVIAVGGDGTINEIVNGFFLNGKPLNPDCELGVINCGTGGGYSKTIYGKGSINDQIEQLLVRGSRLLDLGQITYEDFSGETVSRIFVNECQVGIGSDVASFVGRKSKIFGGPIAFGFAATLLAMSMKPVNLNIEFDQENYKECSLLGLVVGNGTECAGGMKLTPQAKLNDGLFDVLSINNMTTGQRLMNLSKVYSGTHVLSNHFSIKRCKKLKIKSDRKIAMECDGEVLGRSPFDIEILHSAIKVKTANINI